MDKKRVFFGFSLEAPWPNNLPSGRLLDKKMIHITLDFIGEVDFRKKKESLLSIPLPSFAIGPVGSCKDLLFLPKKSPHVVAYEIVFLEKENEIFTYQKQLTSYLEEKELLSKKPKDFLPHATVAREPFSIKEWKTSFSPFSFFISGLHLYESLGHSSYNILHTFFLIPAFEEKEHIADIAFVIRGKSFQELFLHAATALSFSSEKILSYLPSTCNCTSIEEVIKNLNELIRRLDIEQGSCFKAISYHGDPINKNSYLEWEMIVDV